MKSYDEYEKTSTDEPAFSCGTDWECWQFSVCMGGGVDGRRCVNDESIDDDGGCPLILLGVIGQKTPQEWTNANGTVLYRCTEKVSVADVQRAAKAEQEAAAKAALQAEHYSMFPEVT